MLAVPAVPAVPAADSAVLSATLRRRWQALRDEAMAGLRTVAAVPALRALAGIEGLLAFGMALTGTSLMIYVTRDLGLGTGELGLVFALGGGWVRWRVAVWHRGWVGGWGRAARWR